jgi:integrase
MNLRYLRKKVAKGRTYWYFWTGQRDINGKPILVRLPDVSDVEFGRKYADLLRVRTMRHNAKAKGVLDIDGLIRKYEVSPEFISLAENTKRNYSRYLAAANRLIRGPDGSSPAATSINPRDVVQLRDKLASTPGAASATVRALGALFAWASRPEYGYVPTNPAARIATFKTKPHEQWPVELLEEALSDTAVQLPVALLYFTGQRIGDVVKMRWNDVEGGGIRVFAQKTKSKLWISLSSELAELLDAAPKTSTHILTNAYGRPDSSQALRHRLQAWAKARGHKVVPHGLRKNAVSALLEAGCSIAEVQSITRQTLQMIEHYAQGRDQRQIGRGAIIKLDDHRKRRGGKSGT